MGNGCRKHAKVEYTSSTTAIHWNWLCDPHIIKLPQVKADHFVPFIPLGKGKFGLVFLAYHKLINSTPTHNNKFLAIKYIAKSIIFESKCIERIQQEIDIIHSLNHPFINYCFGCFDCPAYIGIVFEVSMGGELFTRIKKIHSSSSERFGYSLEEIGRFYAGEIALVLHYLHDVMRIGKICM